MIFAAMLGSAAIVLLYLLLHHGIITADVAPLAIGATYFVLGIFFGVIGPRRWWCWSCWLSLSALLIAILTVLWPVWNIIPIWLYEVVTAPELFGLGPGVLFVPALLGSTAGAAIGGFIHRAMHRA